MTMYGFRPSPQYRAGSAEQRLLDSLNQPLSPLATAFSAGEQAMLESPFLGTAIREFTTPPLLSDRPQRGDTPANYAQRVETFEAKAITEEQYKSSPYYREDVPWDRGMTEDRAAALALQADTKAVRDFYSQKRPISAFIGSFVGAALDPINYLPTVGPIVKAAAVAKVGKIGGAMLAASADAAVNTAVFGAGTAPIRARYGDDVSWQSQVSDIAMAAAIGGVFGLGEGVIGKVVADRAAKRELAIKAASDELQTLRRTQEARIALNEAAVGLALDGEVRLSPNGMSAMADIARTVIPDVVRQPETPRSPVGSSTASPARADAPGQASSDAPVISGLEEALNNLRSGAAAAPVSMRKPVIDTLKRLGGVHPDSPLAAELRNAGVTSQSAPGLYRRDPSALQAVDNIPLSEVSARFAGRSVDDGAGYVTQQGWIDAVRDEMAGEPWLTPDEQLRLDEVRKPAEDLDEFMNRFGIDYRDRPNAEVMADIREVERRLMAGFDTSSARADRSMSDADLKHFQEDWADPERPAALSATYRLDPKTGSYLEESDIRQLEREGRLSQEDLQMLADADTTFRNAGAYGEALKAAVSCLL